MDGGATVTVSRAARVSDHVSRVKPRDLSWSPPGAWPLTPASDWPTHQSRDRNKASDWSRRASLRPDWSAASTPPWSSGSGSEEDWAVTSSSSESPIQWTPETPETPRHRQEPDIFELLNKLQGERLNDQRCMMPGSQQAPWTPSRHRLEAVLRGSPPYPMVSLPLEGGFWSDPSNGPGARDHEGNTVNSEQQPLAAIHGNDSDDNPCRTYRAHFLQSEHFNFCGQDEMMGPVVLSVKYYAGDSSSSENSNTNGGTGDHIRLVLRLTSGSVHRLVDRERGGAPSPIALAKLICPQLSLASLQPVLCPRASELLVNYDEHVLVNNFKFGVIYQRQGQTSEEALFGNRGHSPALDRFLDMIGHRVSLASHQGYRGGLDTQFGQTGEQSVYTEHCGKEVMYHVATLLPFSETDPQQLQRKRHIGNDIVSIVFQEANTPFSPDMVASHFLHAFIVVQPEPGPAHSEGDTLYRVSVTARSDVPYFGPGLPSPPVFRRGPQFREWILNKLINAETACYKAEKFAKLEQRTRATLLGNLVEELTSKTHDFLGQQHQEAQSTKSESGGIFKNVKKALASRTKSQAPVDGLGGNKNIPKSKSSSGGLAGHDDQDLLSGSQGRRSLVGGGGRRVGGAGKSDSGRGSVGTGSTGRCSVTSSTGRGSSPVSSTSSPDLANRMPGAHSHQSESDTSSLNSMECGPEQTQLRMSPKKRASLPAFHQPQDARRESGQGNSHMSLDPSCQEIVSGNVTMVTLEGNVVAGQLSKLQDEISKLKVDKLELLRQNVAAQREVKRLRERELQLQSDLTTASREINRLRMNIKQAASSGSVSHSGRSDGGQGHGGHPGLTSASLASLSLRSPPSDSDRQH